MYDFYDITVEFEFSTGVWTDVYDDVIGDIKISRGIKGNGPLDRVASTGTCVLTLDNSNGAYTPGHTNCTSGFEHGVAFRVRFQKSAISDYVTKFYGIVDDINPAPSNGLNWQTQVIAVDFINQLADQDINKIEFAENKRLDEIAELIVTSLPYYPSYRVFSTATSTFPTVFDTSNSNTMALGELSKATMSELGFVFIQYGEGDDAIFSYGRHTSVGGVVLGGQFTDEDIFNIGLSYGKNYYNDIKTTVYPRDVDAAATSILYSLNYPLQIEPGETITLKGTYKDPNQEAVSVTGRDMVTPVSTTDYTFNAQSDGGGSDITADLDVIATYGVNGVEYELTNNNAGVGYVTKLQARGKGIYIYRPVEYRAEDSAGITSNGRKTLDLKLLYQDDPNVGKDFADALLDIYKIKTLHPEWIDIEINSNADALDLFCTYDIFYVISLDLNDLDIDANYLITGVDITITMAGRVFCRYYITPEVYLPSGNFWKLDSATKSQLGSTTILAF